MRSPLQTRRQSLLPVLALLGAAVTLSPAPRAAAIGGNVGQSSSPRETTGATPSVSLFQTSGGSFSGGGGGGSSSNAPSAEVTARGSTSSNRDTGGGGEDRPAPSRRRRSTAASETTREESRPESAGRRRTAARREREEVRSGRTRETAVASSGGKDAVSGKDKNVMVQQPADRPLLTVGSGWQSRYLYRGLDVIGFNARFNESSSIWFTNLGLEYKGFRFKLDYVQAVDSVVPFYQGNPKNSDQTLSFVTDNNGNLVTTGKGNFQFDQNGNVIGRVQGFKRRIFREIDPGFSYTLGIANLFDATLGYTFFLFPNDDFKGTHYQGETLFRLTYKQLKYVKASFSYFHFNSPFDDATIGDLNGNYVEFRLDGTLPLIDRPNFGMSIEPYLLGSYNINYLKFGGTQDVGGFNTFETGIKVPVRVGKHFTVTPYGNYGLNISGADQQVNSFYGGDDKTSQFGERKSFWGGVSVAYTF